MPRRLNRRCAVHGLQRAALVCVLAALACGSAALPGAQDAHGASFQVSPTRFEFPLDRRFTNFFTVTNNSPAPLSLRIYAKFVQVGEDDKMVEVEGNPLDLTPLLVINPRRISLPPSERRVVRFSVRPPEGEGKTLTAGEYRTVIFFEELPGPPDSADKSAADPQVPTVRLALLTRLGVTLYGMVGEKALAVSLQQGKATAGPKEVTLDAFLVNDGNAHAQLELQAVLADHEGKPVQRREWSTVVQRNQRRRIQVTFDRPPPGAYQVLLTGQAGKTPVLESTIPLAVESATGN